MAGILRGEIRWANLDPAVGQEQSGRRPVLIISRNTFNEYSATVIGMAITSREPKAGFPFTLELKSIELPRKSWVKISQVRILSVMRIGRLIGRISDEDLAQVIEGLNEIIA